MTVNFWMVQRLLPFIVFCLDTYLFSAIKGANKESNLSIFANDGCRFKQVYIRCKEKKKLCMISVCLRVDYGGSIQSEWQQIGDGEHAAAV